MNITRKALLAIAFAVTAAGALTGATFSGESKEVDLAVTADNRLDMSEMELRFTVAFQ
jgi:hypothetical protein